MLYPKVALGLRFISESFQPHGHLLSWLLSPISSSVSNDEYLDPHEYADPA